MAELLQSDRLDSPDGTRVQVLFYDDESIRFRIYRKPLVIEEAFLTGNQQGHSIIKVAPTGRPATAGEAGSEDRKLSEAEDLLREFLKRFYWLKDHPDFFAEVRIFLGEDPGDQ